MHEQLYIFMGIFSAFQLYLPCDYTGRGRPVGHVAHLRKKKLSKAMIKPRASEFISIIL